MEVRAVLEAPAMSAHKVIDPDAEAVAATRADPSAFLALYDPYFRARARICAGSDSRRGDL